MKPTNTSEAAHELGVAVKGLLLIVCTELRINKLVDWINVKLSKLLR